MIKYCLYALNHSSSELPFLNLKKFNGVAFVGGCHFHPAAVHKHPCHQSGFGDIGAFCDGNPLAQELKKTASPSAK